MYKNYSFKLWTDFTIVYLLWKHLGNHRTLRGGQISGRHRVIVQNGFSSNFRGRGGGGGLPFGSINNSEVIAIKFWTTSSSRQFIIRRRMNNVVYDLTSLKPCDTWPKIISNVYRRHRHRHLGISSTRAQDHHKSKRDSYGFRVLIKDDDTS